MRTSLTLLLLGLAVQTVQAQTAPAAKKASAPAVSSQRPEPSVENLTCGDLLFMLGDEKQTQDSTYLMFWAYGIKTGVSGVDLRKHPLTPDGLKIFVRDMYEACKVKSDTKVLDILTGKAGAK